MGRKVYEIGYTADEVIHDPDELVSLCCFYESVWLPLPESRDFRILSYWGRSWDTSDWIDAHRVLLEEGVLKRIEPTAHQIGPRSDSFHELLSRAPIDSSCTLETISNRYFWGAIDERTEEMRLPCLFVPPKNVTRAWHLASWIEREAFGYFLPYLHAIPNRDISNLTMTIRGKTSDLREGFSCYLLELSKEIDSAIDNDSTPEEIHKATEHLVETRLGPKVDEYLRCLAGHKAKWWKKVLGPVARTVEVLFFGKDLAKAIRIVGESGLTVAQVLSDRHTNLTQAQKFLGIIKDEGNRLTYNSTKTS